MTVLVTGATGTVGRHLVTQLLAAGQKVRALTRDPAAAALPPEVEVVAGDLTSLGTLAAAFDGVTAAHLINFGGGYQPLDNGPELVDLVVRSGIGRVTMLGGWQEGTVEPAVRASGLEWTHLRPLEFMGNTLPDWGPRLRRDGVIREPYGDRRSAAVHESDIAAVAAVALTEPGHAGQSYLVTGPEALSPRDKIRHLSAATGRDLSFVELTPEETRREWVAGGGMPDLLLFRATDAEPAQLVELLLRLYGNTPEYGYTVTGTVEKVTGRPARTFAQWAVEHAEEFRP
jgi:uncharacterized protein YbjT (DUF2867 family)